MSISLSPIKFAHHFTGLLILRREVLEGVEHQLGVPLRHAQQARLGERVRALGQ